SWHVVCRIAAARAREHIRRVATDLARFLLPRPRLCDTGRCAEFSSLGACPPGRWRILLPRSSATTLDWGFGPIFRLHSFVRGAFFLPRYRPAAAAWLP